MRLRYFLILIFFALALIPVVFFRAWPTTVVFDTEMDEVHERHLLLVRNLAAAIERYHRDLSNTFELIVSTPEIWENSTVVAGTLGDLGFRQLCTADAVSGRILHNIATPDSPCPAAIPAETLMQFMPQATSNITFSEVTKAVDGEKHPLSYIPFARGADCDWQMAPPNPWVA